MMRFCAKCGNRVGEDDGFCVSCGAPIKVRPNTQRSAKDKAHPTFTDEIITEWNKIRETGQSEYRYQNSTGKKETAYRDSANAYRDASSRATNEMPGKTSETSSKASILRDGITGIVGGLVIGTLIFFVVIIVSGWLLGGYTHCLEVIVDFLEKTPELHIPATVSSAQTIIKIIMMCLAFSCYMLGLRVSGATYKVISSSDRIAILLSTYFFIGCLVWLVGSIIVRGTLFLGVKEIFRANADDRLIKVLPFLGYLLFLLIPIWLMKESFKVLSALFVSNIEVNGFFLGILSAFFDILSSVFIVLSIMAVVCLGIGMVLGVIVVIAACFSGQKRYVTINGVTYEVIE